MSTLEADRNDSLGWEIAPETDAHYDEAVAADNLYAYVSARGEVPLGIMSESEDSIKALTARVELFQRQLGHHASHVNIEVQPVPQHPGTFRSYAQLRSVD